MVYYFGMYDTLSQPHNRAVSPACCNKMEYVAKAVNEAGCEVKIVSTAYPKTGRFRFTKASNTKNADGVQVHFLQAAGGRSRFSKPFSQMWTKIVLFFFLLSELKKGQTIIVYHSMAYMTIFPLMKRLFSLKLILEVEEIYAEIVSLSSRQKKNEKKIFERADGYIFSTEVFNERVNIDKKPFVILYGNYSLAEIINTPKEDGKTHIVYSGTFNAKKGGAMAAIEAARCLNSDYHIHITGWGTERETESIRKAIDSIQSHMECELSYDGFIDNKDFPAYLQGFHIGLCSQNPDDPLSSACFPSKIFVYMSNGLSVVSSSTEPIKKSRIARYLSFYDEQNGESIAKAIMRCNRKNNNRNVLSTLHVEGVELLKTIFGK